MTLALTRRAALLVMAAPLLLAACASKPVPADPTPPIVFVHGRGDNAATWMPTIWRFESNGWPRERLHAVEFPYPTERDDDTKPQDGRSSTTDQRLFLAASVLAWMSLNQFPFAAPAYFCYVAPVAVFAAVKIGRASCRERV